MKPCSTALLALAATLALPTAGAQTPPAPAAPPTARASVPAAAPAVPDTPISTVTVLGRLSKKPSATVRRLSSAASSCAYSFNSAAEELTDAYLDHFQGRSRDGNSDANPERGEDPDNPNQDDPNSRSFNDNSPAGDAKTGGTVRPSEAATDVTKVVCGQTDRNNAAARNQIARRDKSLDQAYAAYDSGDFAKALALFQTAYKRVGWDDAALMVGNMLASGQGQRRDLKQAIAWYDKVAAAPFKSDQLSPFDPANPEQASARAEAQVRLARIYMAGGEVAADPKAARRWYQAASELNYVPARHVLARMLLTGYGGDKNPAQAVKLLTNAAEYGYAPAQWTLARLYDEGGSGVARDAQQAFAWYQQAAVNPRGAARAPYAQLALARMYDSGNGVKADAARALRFYQAAAVAGHPEAQNALATYFYEGRLVGQDLALARKLFIAAASQGDAESMTNAGVMLFKGEGGAADMVQSYVWLRLAERLGHAPAAPMAALVEKRLSAAQRAQADSVLAPAPKKG